MKEIISGFEYISFHDASIDLITRNPNSVAIDFTGAYIGRDHPLSNGSDWRIDSGKLELSAVAQEEAIFWSGDRVSEPHPEPNFPLDEVMQASFDGVRFTFQGFLRGAPWYEWIVVADRFRMVPLKISKIDG